MSPRPTRTSRRSRPVGERGAGPDRPADVRRCRGNAIVVVARRHRATLDEDVRSVQVSKAGLTRTCAARSRPRSRRELEAAGLPRVTVHPGRHRARRSGPWTERQLLDVGPRWHPPRRLVAVGRCPRRRPRDRPRPRRPIGARLLQTSGVDAPRHGRPDRRDPGLHPRRRFASPSMIRRLARLNDLAGGRLGSLPKAGRLDSARERPFGRRLTIGAGAGPRLPAAPRDIADTIRWWASNGTITPKWRAASLSAPRATGHPA